jgi:uncharacterized membrane protein YozB (DUF420 family)
MLMVQAPIASTFVAIALIPVAILFTHAYFSGRKGWHHHVLSGTAAVVWDLSLSIFYMLYRTFGGATDGSVLVITPALNQYFIVHGLVSIIVIFLEIAILTTGLLQWRSKGPIKLHRQISTPLYALWFLAFISGEAVYLAFYVL